MEKKKANIKVQKEVQRLQHELEAHNYRYYVLNQPVISDKEYDDLLKRLIKLEEEHPQLQTSHSPSQRIGSLAKSAGTTVRHRVKMFSLDNTYSLEEFKDWQKRVAKALAPQKIEYVVELKIDGVSAALTYRRGVFVMGATRGDGTTGEDVSHSLKTVRSIPLRLRGAASQGTPELIDVRGEIYMTKRDFVGLNNKRKKAGDVLFANPRNATGGSLKLLDSRITAQRHLHCFIHSFGVYKGTEPISSHWEFLQKAQAFGFCINPHSRLCHSLDEIVAFYNEFLDKRNDLEYEVDGVVVKVNSFAQRNELGETLKSPRWAVAFKFPAHQATTFLKDISIQVGRTGVLTPVAELEPVECGGVIISRATLHNFDEVTRLGIKIRDKVLLERAGDVIPKIIKVIAHGKPLGRTIQVPQRCPVCGGAVMKDKSDRVAYRCINLSCPKQIERRLVHFASRPAMDINGLGEVVVTQLLDKGLVKDLADIYDLRVDNFLGLALFKEKKAQNLMRAIEQSKQQPLSRFLFGLGILNIGEKASQILADKFGHIDRIMDATEPQLEAIDEMGSVMAASVVAFFKQAETRKLIARFKKAGLHMTQPLDPVGQKLHGMKFVFTGEMPEISRAQASALVKKLGGDVLSSVSKNVNFVVAGAHPGSKFKKAQALGLKIIDAKQFEEMTHE